ncbi:hypothetical protein UlMin_023338 [Ulmus minor]
MTEEEVLWHELEHGVSQQGSSSEGNPFADIPSARVMSQTGAGPSGRVTEGVDSDDDEAEVDSEETEILAAAKALDAESDLESYPGEGMLLKNPRSSVATEDIRLWRYLYGIPPSVEVRVPTAHERVDWVVPGWVAIYELMLKDGMRFPIPRLLRDVCDHYEIAPSQLMPNAWRVLMSLESLSVCKGVDCELGEVLFSYYLKEHDKDKGRFKLIARVGRAPIITCLRTNDRGWKDRFIFVRGDLVWGPRGPGGVSGHWKATSRDFNRALPRGLIAEERTRQLLDIVVGERDYRVALSEENLRASRLWDFVEERPGIAAIPVDFVLNLLRLRHSIHIVFGGSDLRPLTVEEFSLAEDLMSGRINIPSAKEAKQMMKGAASSSQREKKRKRVVLADTRVVDDPEAYKLSKAEAAVGKSQSTGSGEPSPGKAKKAKGKSTEGGDSVVLPMPSDGSVYSDPSFVKDATEALLLPADRKRLSEIGPVQAAEWSCAHAYQALMGWTHLRNQITALEKRNVDLTASNATLRKSNEKLTTKLEELKTRDEELSSNNNKLVDQNARILGQLDEVKEELHVEKATTASLRTEVESITAEAQAIAVNAVLSARAELMAEFKKGEHSSWDPDEEIRTWERRQTLMAGGEVSEEEEVEEAALAAESPKQKDDVAPEQGEPAAGGEGIVPEPEDAAATEDSAAGAEDIAKD